MIDDATRFRAGAAGLVAAGALLAAAAASSADLRPAHAPSSLATLSAPALSAPGFGSGAGAEASGASATGEAVGGGALPVPDFAIGPLAPLPDGFVALELAALPASSDAAPPTRVAGDDAPCAFAVNRAELARRLEDNRPIAAEQPFEADGRPVYVWLETNNLGGRGRVAELRWVHEPSGWTATTQADLAFSARWRTWMQLSVPAQLLGAWRVEVLDAERCEVERLRFTMQPPGW